MKRQTSQDDCSTCSLTLDSLDGLRSLYCSIKVTTSAVGTQSFNRPLFYGGRSDLEILQARKIRELLVCYVELQIETNQRRVSIAATEPFQCRAGWIDSQCGTKFLNSQFYFHLTLYTLSGVVQGWNGLLAKTAAIALWRKKKRGICQSRKCSRSIFWWTGGVMLLWLLYIYRSSWIN